MSDVRRTGCGVFCVAEYLAECLAASRHLWAISLAVTGVLGDQGAGYCKAEFGGLAAQSVDVIASETL